MNTFFLKRVDMNNLLFCNTDLRIKNPLVFERKTKVRIIIPTYNRYNVLYNLLKNLKIRHFQNFMLQLLINQKDLIKSFIKILKST